MSEGEGDGDELEEGEGDGEGRNVTALDPRGGEAWHLSTVCFSLIPSLTFGSFSISPELLKAGQVVKVFMCLTVGWSVGLTETV